jgi:haloalkane dehalogenase
MRRRDFLSGVTTMVIASAMNAFTKSGEEKALDAQAFQTSRHWAELGNKRIAYIERGHGPAVLFLHGFPLNGFQWRGALNLLAKHRRCIAADFMGLGYTEVAEEQDLSPEAQAEMLAALLDALEIKSADIVANDSGGSIAQLFVARHMKRVRTLLLTNCDVDTNSPPPSFQPFLEAAKKGLLAEGIARQLADKELARSAKGLGAFYTNPAALTDEAIQYYFSPLVSSPARKAQCNRYAAAFEQNPLVAIRSDLQRCAVPTRILWGTADTVFDVAWAHWLDTNLPQSRGVRLIQGAKLFFPEEMPDVIAEEALRLWAGHNRVA